MNNKQTASHFNLGLRALLAAALLATGSGLCPLSPSSAETAPPPAEAPPGPKRFNFADVHRRAAELATRPYAEPAAALPDYLRDLTYDQYRDIRYRSERALWRDEQLPFEVQLFPRGFMFRPRVQINIVANGEVKPVAYANDLFDYGANKVPDNLPADLGFAGFRLHYPLHQDSYYDEVAVFLGASYFRAVGQNQHYGISARALAIDTGLGKEEEFPVFQEFWLEKPARDATEITVYALLDSPSVTGAYRFVIKPGLATVVAVKGHIFMRQRVEKLGLAPLTSMFFHGELTERRVDDFRPEVHDSDGLLMAAGSGEWIWRPLDNPTRLRIASFQDTKPRGFGLLQRDREFANYQDLEASYQTRPSVWVEPLGDWGKGVVQLLEIPTDAERYDNIVAFWIPDRPVEAGQDLDFEYRLHFVRYLEERPPGGRTLATRIGGGGTAVLESGRRKFVIDFAGRNLARVGPEAPVKALVDAASGKVTETVVQKNPFIDGWRVFFELTPEGDQPSDLRLFLKLGEDVLTETWSYQWTRP